MISIAISLVVILAISGLYLSQRATYNTQGALSRIQENARYLMQVLTRDVRLSGYRDINATASFVTNAAGSKLFITGRNDTGLNGSDELTLQFFGASDTSGNADGSITDCRGTAIGRDTLVTQIYTVQLDATTNEPALFCDNGGAAGAVALVSGIESLQFLYAVDINSDGARFSYQPEGVADSSKATSLLISVVLRSTTGNEAKGLTAPVFNHFGDTYASGNVAPASDPGSVFKPANDGRIRKHITFSVSLRNRLD
ncbi:hypothetical protein GCM10022212_15310 [Actimicrobium antarcticum]|uniref:Type IV pilus assembly protein PilW n=2 Tax=Actimicrobium antarcticum TaxID=1051899 RepID=A0ABP7T2B2_9BURK